jgi:hypothetical protein
MMRTMRWVQRMKNSQQRGDQGEIRLGESGKNMVGVWCLLLGNIIINVRMSQSQINFNTVKYYVQNIILLLNLKCSSNIKLLLR